MKIGFMSSVCPAYTLPELLDAATRHNYQHLELRVEWGHMHGVELTMSAAAVRQTKAQFADSGIALSCIATGIRLSVPHVHNYMRQLEQLRQYLMLAEMLNAQHVRVFGDPLPRDDAGREHAIYQVAEALSESEESARRHGVNIVLETHGNMRGYDVKEAIDRAESPHAFANWHPAHPVRHGEPTYMSYRFLKPYLRHVHVFGPAGPFDDPATDALNTLAADDYTGTVSLETINPPDPEAVLAYHARSHPNGETSS